MLKYLMTHRTAVAGPVGTLATASLPTRARARRQPDTAERVLRPHKGQAQRIIGKHFYRPRDKAIEAEYAERYPQLKMVTIADFGGWDAAQAKYFADGGMFDRIFTPGQ
jgi:ABC-type sulfate transport system substrate-binding protein